jgi:hypothetical protein
VLSENQFDFHADADADALCIGRSKGTGVADVVSTFAV